ncbi:MAG: 6-phosphogluconolactonase [Anaerolineales bacterium]|nr:6-phosphogluconolactonase [Anaerolineales bacterium]
MDLHPIFQLPAADLPSRSPVRLTVVESLPVLFADFAQAIADELAANNAAGHPTKLILPVGPVNQYPLLAERCNRAHISWRHAHLFFMDEYCDWQGQAVSVDHPLSFEGFARRMLFAQLDAGLAPPDAQIHFPNPRRLDEIETQIHAVGGIDTCYGGIGVHGHIAFNEPPISRWFRLTPAEFKASRTRLVQLAPETVVMNATRAAGGNFAALPPMAVTLGMAAILGARRIRLYCQGGAWQRAVLRIALFGSPNVQDASGEDVDYPVTLLRSHADLAITTDLATAQPAIPAMAA